MGVHYFIISSFCIFVNFIIKTLQKRDKDIIKNLFLKKKNKVVIILQLKLVRVNISYGRSEARQLCLKVHLKTCYPSVIIQQAR